MIYKLNVRNRVITHPANDDLIQGGIQSDTISVTFDSEWRDQTSYRAVFLNGDDVVAVLFDMADTVNIEVPWEVLQNSGHLYVSFIAYEGDVKRIVTRIMERPFRVACGGRIDGDESRTPSTDEIQALINAVNSATAEAAEATKTAGKAAESATSAAESATSAAASATSAATSATTAAESASKAADAATKTNSDISAAERLRVTAESSRVSAESNRVNAETGRVAAEIDRVTSEAKRKADFTDMVDRFNGLQTYVLKNGEYDSSGVPIIEGDPNLLYLVQIEGPSDDQYNEFIEWICPSPGKWEVIGSTRTTIKAMSTDTIDSVMADASPSGTEVMDVTRLSYFWAKLKAFFARADHTHPPQTSVSGNAGTATKLKNARSIALFGDVAGFGSFDGSNDLTINATIAALAVETGMLADGSITTAKIKDGTIATADLANLAITAAKLADGSVTAAKLEAALLKRITDLETAWASVSQTTQTVGGTPIYWRVAHVGALHIATGMMGRLSDADWAALTSTGIVTAVLPPAYSIGGYPIDTSNCFVSATSRNERCCYGGLMTNVQNGAGTISFSNITTGVAPFRDYPGWLMAVFVG